MGSKKTIWFVNKDAAPIDVYATHLRTVKQAQYFQQQGYDVKLVCSANVHNKDVNYVDKGWYVEQIHDGIPFIFVKSLKYGDSKLKRIIAYFLFSLNVNRLCKYLQSPDVVIHTSKIPFDYPIYTLAKRKKAKYILDITDLWPMEFEHFGFLSKGNPILKMFYGIEKYLYHKADHVVMSMEGCHQYIKDHKWDKGNGGPIDLNKIHYVNNGIDIDEFNHNAKSYFLHDRDLEDDTICKVIYMGSIRQANDVEQLIDAAKHLQSNNNVRFLIYGDGPDRALLEEKCHNEGITNVLFKQKWIEPRYVPYVLSKASINILNYAAGWAPYGGSMNKMFMSFASGKPILCNAGMKYSPIRDNDLGIDRILTSSDDYASAIMELVNMPKDERLALEKRSIKVAMQFHIPCLIKKIQTYCEL